MAVGSLVAPAVATAEPTIQTATTISCGSATRFPGVEVQCTVSVKSSGAGATAPTGLVRLTAQGGEINSTCTLIPLIGPQSVCIGKFVGKEGGVQTITASYVGDQTHLPSSGKTTVAVSTTATSLSCQPGGLAVGEASICTAEVRNTGAASDVLSGTLSFKSDHEGRFEPSTCRVDESSVCAVKYLPAVGAAHLVTATYEGDATHPPSHAEVTLSVRGTSVKLICTQQSQAIYEPASCVARVVNEGLGSRSLTGTVRFMSSLDGRFSSAVCTLAPFLNEDGGFCGTTYTPEAAGAHVIRAVYSGDATHPPAIDGKSQVNALPRPTTTRVACAGSPSVGESTTCMAHVRDNSSIHGTAPVGGIEWLDPERDPRSLFVCILEPVNSVESACSWVYAPEIGGTQLLTARYPGAEGLQADKNPREKVHGASEASLRLIYPTTTEVDCGDSAVLGEAKVCTATVRVHDIEPRPTEGGATAPTGATRFSSPAMGTFGQTSCALAPIGPDASSCSVSYRPQAAGSHPISAFYGSDSTHESSFDTKDLEVRSP